MLKLIKFLPYLTLLSTIVVGTLVIDERYARAQEFETYQTEQAQAVSDLGKDLEQNRLEDNLLELELIPHQERTPREKALISHYERKIEKNKAKYR